MTDEQKIKLADSILATYKKKKTNNLSNNPINTFINRCNTREFRFKLDNHISPYLYEINK